MSITEIPLQILKTKDGKLLKAAKFFVVKIIQNAPNACVPPTL